MAYAGHSDGAAEPSFPSSTLDNPRQSCECTVHHAKRMLIVLSVPIADRTSRLDCDSRHPRVPTSFELLLVDLQSPTLWRTVPEELPIQLDWTVSLGSHVYGDSHVPSKPAWYAHMWLINAMKSTSNSIHIESLNWTSTEMQRNAKTLWATATNNCQLVLGASGAGGGGAGWTGAEGARRRGGMVGSLSSGSVIENDMFGASGYKENGLGLLR